MRAATEKLLNLIAQGKEDFRLILKHTIRIFELKYRYFVQSISGMDELFEVSFSPLASTGKPLSRSVHLIFESISLLISFCLDRFLSRLSYILVNFYEFSSDRLTSVKVNFSPN